MSRRGGGREPCHSPKYFGQPHSSLPHRLRAEPPHRGGEGVSTPFSTAYGTIKTVPCKAPVNPICRRGLDPSGDVCPIPGIHGQPPAPPAGRRGRRPLQRPASFPIIVHARAVCGMAYPGRCSTWNICRTFFAKNPFFIPSVCAIIDASGPKAAKKRKKRGGTAWQKSSQ